MRSRSLAHRFVRCAVAVVVLAAANAWAGLSPLHAGGPGVLRTAATAMPCHAQVSSDDGASLAKADLDPTCAALCAVAAPEHYLGQAVVGVGIAAVKLLPPAPAVASAVPPIPERRVVVAPEFRRSDGLPVYLDTGRLRI